VKSPYLVLLPLLAACTVSEAGREASIAAPTSASHSYNDPSRVDLDGSVDLIVEAKATENHWRVKNEVISDNLCSAIEGGVTPGNRRLLRFTVTTPNIGDADNFIGNPKEHFEANDGLFELDVCHGHFHFKHYATYKLIDASGKTWKSAKRGFCMLDTDPYNVNNGDGTWTYRSCGTTTRDGNQGVSSGWADTYTFDLGGQYFVLDGGDGQPVVPPGVYTIEVEVNPAYAATRKGCPRVTDPLTGLCHQFAEASYANNVGRAQIIIPDHPGRQGYGTIKNAPTITKESEIDHKGQ